MKKTREQLKADLLKRIEAKLDEVVEWAEAHPKANLTEIETYLLEVDEAIRETLTGEVMSHKESRQEIEAPRCAECGGQTRYKGMKRKTVVTRLGEVAIKRGYYWCQRCERGVFPPR